MLYCLGPSASPSNITALAVDSRTLQVNWSPPLLEHQNGRIVEYTIDVFNQETGEKVQYNTKRNALFYNINELHPNYFYLITVSAATLVGRGPVSKFYSIRMPEDGK